MAPKYQVLCGLASDDGIDLVSGFRGVSLRVGFCFDVVLGFGLIYFNNLKSRIQNTTKIHNSSKTEDLGAPIVRA